MYVYVHVAHVSMYLRACARVCTLLFVRVVCLTRTESTDIQLESDTIMMVLFPSKRGHTGLTQNSASGYSTG